MAAVEQFDFRGAKWKRVTVEASERWIVGVDLGQAADFTAVAVMRHHVTPLDDWTADHAKRITRQATDDFADVLHLERVALRTDYGAIADHVRNILDRDPLRLAEQIDLVIDDTGVGRAVGDDMAKRLALNPFLELSEGNITRHRVKKLGTSEFVSDAQIDRLASAASSMRNGAEKLHELAVAIKKDPSIRGSQARLTFTDNAQKALDVASGKLG